VSSQPPDGEPGSDAADPQAPLPGPGSDAETARLPWDVAASPTPPPPPEGWAPPPSFEAPSAAATPPAPPAPPVTEPPSPGSAGPSVLWASPTTATRAEIPGAPGLAFADTASRFVAYVIDGILVSIVGWIIAALLGFGRTSVLQSSNATTASYTVAGAAFLVPFVFVGFVYFVFFWTGGRRATPGQQIFKLQVGNAFDGNGLTFTQASKRWLAFGTFLGLFAVLPAIYPLASLIEFVWIIALFVTTVRSPTKQGLHDRFANTAVVRPASESSSNLATTCLVITLVVVGLFFALIIGLIFLGSQISNILSRAGTSI